LAWFRGRDRFIRLSCHRRDRDEERVETDFGKLLFEESPDATARGEA
jgi:hypothetical protein